MSSKSVTGRTVRVSRWGSAIVGGALAVVLVIDPFGLGLLAPQLSATADGGTGASTSGLSRTERLGDVLERLGLTAPVAANELTGSWDGQGLANAPLPGAGSLPPAQEQLLTVAATGSAPLVALDGLSAAVTPSDTGGDVSEVSLSVAGESEARQAGVTGVLLRLTDESAAPEPNPEVTLTVGYDEFAGSFGADWASRLQMVWLPDCPGGGACAPQPLESTNDLVAGTLTASVPVTPNVAGAGVAGRGAAAPSGAVAIMAGPSGGSGDWSATSLSPSSTWGHTGATGAFSWSVPITAPTVPAGPAPELALSYSSAASDGRTPSTNNQSGLIGEGFDLTTGYIERSYVPCAQDVDGAANNAGRPSGDLCWGAENATLVFNGSAAELVRDATTGVWHAKRDDGSRIERLTGAWNGGQADEYWKVTTSDGIQYVFGRDRRSGADVTALGSAWTVPVYGNHPGEPCYHAPASGGFAASQCTQVWRWNLEYVVDPSGNSMTYFYQKESNRYVFDVMGNTALDTVGYVSGGHLDRIEYGTVAGSETAAPAPAKVTLTTTPRCITSLGDPSSFCGSGQTSTSANFWPDTPVDLVCASSAGCTNFTPVFFDRYRLGKVSTFAYDGTAYQPVDSWTIGQRFVAQGTGVGLEYATGAMLVATSVTHTGHGGTSTTSDDLTLPPDTFGYTFLENRVDSAGDGYPPLWRPRITNVRTESGASITVDYRTECTPADLPGTSDTAQRDNTRLCYPVKWFPDGGAAVVQYFHKYVVDTVVEDGAPVVPGSSELITGSVSKVTSYAYGGGAAWAKPTGAMVRPGEVSYSEFRGFAEVTTTVGTGTDASRSRNSYYRGMGGTLTAGPSGHTITAQDRDAYVGQVFAAADLVGSSVLSETVSVPGTPVTVATSTAGLTATRIPSTTGYGFSYDAAGALQFRTRVVTSFNANSQIVSIDDRGDLATTADDLCTTVHYADEADSALAAKHLVGLAASTETVSVACGQSVTRPTDVVSAQRASYDTAGRTVRSEVIDPADGDGYVLDHEVLEYDARGRPVRVGDALGNESRVAYQHSAGGLLQSVTTTTPDPDGIGPLTGFTATTAFNPLTGLVTSTTDANGRVSTGSYDALGRLLKAWYPQHAGSSVPSVQYDYLVQPNGLNSILTRTLGADGVTQHLSSTIYDGLLRPFQSQVEGADAGADHTANAAARGRMVSHSYYDSAGRMVKQTGQWWATGAPTGTPIVPVAVPPSQTTVSYDAAGRPIAQVFWVGNDSNPANERWRSLTGYDGATTVSVPPLGGTPTATITDARGRVVELREYPRDPLTNATVDTVAEVLALPHQSTTYRYDGSGQLTQMKDPAGNQWDYSYDWAGRQISASDPDSGTRTTSYDLLGRVVSRTDANGDTLAYSYDVLGRPTTLRDGSTSGTVRVQWQYDQAHYPDGSPVLGQLSSSTRYVDGNAYTTTIPSYDKGNRPLATTVTLPNIPAFSALASRSFTTSYKYTADGQLSTLTLPAVQAADGSYRLGAENVTTHYDTASMPSWMGGGFGWGAYVADSRFAADGRPLAHDLGNTYGAIVSYRYEEGTNRLQGISLDRERFDGTDLNLGYTYDAAGNVTSIADQPTAAAVAGASSHDTQCFDYDGLRRLRTAWTAASDDCATSPSALQSSDIGGISPYWQEYRYDLLGNRTKLIEHAAGASPARTTTYAHGAGGAGPHQLTSSTTTTGASTVSTSYSYDASGNRASTTTGTDTVSYGWSPEGQLASVGDESNVFDASGNRLVRQDAAGVTVFLPGGQQFTIASGGTVSALRYYSFAGVVVAVRNGAGLGAVSSLVCDGQGTPVAVVPNTVWTAGSVQRVRHDPFGAIRGGSGSTLPGDRRFLGAVRDGAGLTLLGARFYDEAVGRFISVDPVLQPGVPAQFNAYVYSGSNPVTWADPSGLWWGDDLWKGVQKAASNVASFVNTYKAEIVGGLVGVAVFVGCTAATAGAGAIACGIAAGAAGAAVTSLMHSAETGKFSVSGFLTDVTFGAVLGGVGAAAGPLLGALLKPAASAAGNALVTLAKGAVNALAPRVSLAVNSAATAIRTAVSGAASGIRTAASSAVNGVRGAANTTVSSIRNGIKATLNAARRPGGGGGAGGGESPAGTYLYRGLNETHHAYEAGLKGEAWPGDILGHIDAAAHNAGVTENSMLTSWTTDLGTAERFALDPTGRGLILRTTMEGQVHRVVPGPDSSNEAEVLLRGMVSSAESWLVGW